MAWVQWIALPYLFFRLVRAYLLVDLSCMQGKAVIITGASSGFGRAVALKMHELGAVVFAGCNRQSSVNDLTAEFASSNRMRPILLNVSNGDHVAQAVETISQSGLPLRSVINNAGISAFGWAEVLPVERHAQNVDVNYLGAVRMTRAFLPLLRLHKGRLVNMGSIGARMPSAFGSSYLPAKAAMLSYSECVRQETYRHGVKVVYIEPGFFETSLLTSARANGAAHAAALGTTAAAAAPTKPDRAVCPDETERAEAYPSFETKMAKTAEQIRVFENLNGGAKGVDAVVDATSERAARPSNHARPHTCIGHCRSP
jgi:NAD(P)-dependent dehydrogenase (short-subunit alcohol dehydrogenase family)